jgi:predicted DNA binding protein
LEWIGQVENSEVSPVTSIDGPTLLSYALASGSVYEIVLRFLHDRPYSGISRSFPAARFSVWDNLRREFVDVRSNNPGDWPRMNQELESLATGKGSKILWKSSDGDNYEMVMMTCACETTGTTLNWVMESDCLFVPPIRLLGGWERYHAVGFDRGSAGRLLRKFQARGKAEIASQKRVDVRALSRASFVPMLDPLSGLTRMQLSALTTSMAMGYYRLPRKTSTGKIAKTLKVPRTTFQEHRKKAESKLMAALAPYVLTYGNLIDN